ncbi:MAG: hypothetical protein JMDDDDMK_04357 [Acidobacteria bacterium]|nr:hypothetical protein [Acidobacteriota bacterium]
MKARDCVMKSRLAGTIAGAGRNEHRQADKSRRRCDSGPPLLLGRSSRILSASSQKNLLNRESAVCFGAGSHCSEYFGVTRQNDDAARGPNQMADCFRRLDACRSLLQPANLSHLQCSGRRAVPVVAGDHFHAARLVHLGAAQHPHHQAVASLSARPRPLVAQPAGAHRREPACSAASVDAGRHHASFPDDAASRSCADLAGTVPVQLFLLLSLGRGYLLGHRWRKPCRLFLSLAARKNAEGRAARSATGAGASASDRSAVAGFEDADSPALPFQHAAKHLGAARRRCRSRRPDDCAAGRFSAADAG